MGGRTVYISYLYLKTNPKYGQIGDGFLKQLKTVKRVYIEELNE